MPIFHFSSLTFNYAYAGYSALNLAFDSPDYYLEVQVDDNSDFSSSETLSPRSGYFLSADPSASIKKYIKNSVMLDAVFDT